MPQYPLTAEDEARLAKTFTYHPPTAEQAERYETIRQNAHRFAEVISVLCPPSGERTLAIRSIEQAVGWANASITRGETPAAEIEQLRDIKTKINDMFGPPQVTEIDDEHRQRAEWVRQESEANLPLPPGGNAAP